MEGKLIGELLYEVAIGKFLSNQHVCKRKRHIPRVAWQFTVSNNFIATKQVSFAPKLIQMKVLVAILEFKIVNVTYDRAELL